MTIFQKIKEIFRLRRPHGEKIDIVYPVSWDTMNQEDFQNVCTILSGEHGKKETLFLCLMALAHLRPGNPICYDPKAVGKNMVFLIGDKSYVISPDVIREACSQLEYIYDTIGLSPCPLPGIDRKLYGISFEQYYKADAFMLQYYASGNDERWLKEATKVLTGGRIRRLLPWQKKGLAIWWNGLKHFFMEKYSFVLHEGGSSTVTDRTMDELLLDLLSAMNDDKPQENEKILKSDVHSVMHCLDRIYQKNAQH